MVWQVFIKRGHLRFRQRISEEKIVEIQRRKAGGGESVSVSVVDRELIGD